jgi:Fungal fucose-specific lectin
MRVPTVAASSPDAVGPAREGSGEEGGFAPADFRKAYKLPETGGSGQTVAIVDAYNDPNAYSDLKTYRSTYKLPECTEESGCFKKVNQKGESKNYPANNAGWATEISLDLDMVSATCPGCHILLVEADEPSLTDLGTAENEAATLGATVISNSYGGSEGTEENKYEDEKKYGSYYEHPGIPITVASGDDGYGVEFPAGSPHVIAVGGTALKKEEKSARGWSEEVWRNTEFKVGEKGAGTGSGCTLKEETKPPWQHDTGCSNRTDNDVAAVASCSTPVSVYDTYEVEKARWWEPMCGTSASAPIIGGIEALAEKAVKTEGAEVFYGQPNAEFPVTKGSDGECGGSYLCTASEGYNGPAGMGAPDGVPKVLPIAEDTSPTVIEPGSSNPSVFYVDSNHEIAYWTYTAATGWTNGVIGGSVESGTSPAANYDASFSTGLSIIYFVNKNGEIATWTRLTGAWGETTLGGSVEPGTSPSAFDTSGGELRVAYVNKSKEMAEWRYPGGPSWTNTTLGGSVESGTGPAANYDASFSTGLSIIYFVNKNGEIATWTRLTGAWGETTLGGSVESGTSPAAIDTSGGELRVYYVNEDADMAEWRFSTLWVNSIL